MATCKGKLEAGQATEYNPESHTYVLLGPTAARFAPSSYIQEGQGDNCVTVTARLSGAALDFTKLELILCWAETAPS